MIVFLLYITFIYRYTTSFSELEYESLNAASDKLSVDIQDLYIYDSLSYKNTISLMIKNDSYRTVCIVWRKSVWGNYYKRVSIHLFSTKDVAFVAQDYYSNYLITYNEKLVCVSSEVKPEIWSSLFFLCCISLTKALIFCRKREIA